MSNNKSIRDGVFDSITTSSLTVTNNSNNITTLNDTIINGNITLSNGITVNITLVSPNSSLFQYTVLPTDYILSINTLIFPCTILLPNASLSIKGQIYIIKDVSGNAYYNNITITTVGGTQFIDGSLSIVINTQYGIKAYYTDGYQWLGLDESSSGAGSGSVTSLIPGTGITISGANPTVTPIVGLSTVGITSAGAYTPGASFNVDTFGRITSATNGNNTFNGTVNINGNLNMNSNSILNVVSGTAGTSLVNKSYVDGIASGLVLKQNCNYATTGNLSGAATSYVQTFICSTISGNVNITTSSSFPNLTSYYVSGPGITNETTVVSNGTNTLILSLAATATNSSVTLTFTYNTIITLSLGTMIDGQTMNTSDRCLVKNQTNGIQNGIYVVTVGGSNIQLTRSLDTNISAEVVQGIFTFIQTGTTNINTGWVLITSPPIILENTSLLFTQFSGAGSITANNGLIITGGAVGINSLTGSNLQLTNSNTVLDIKSSSIPNQVLLSSGNVSTPPIYGPLPLNATTPVITGTLPISNGGTNNTNFGNNQVIVSNNTGTTLLGTNSPNITSIITTNNGTLTFPTSLGGINIDTLVGRSTSDILTNKTMSSVITLSGGTLDFPLLNSTTIDTLIGANTSATLTNKNITDITNTVRASTIGPSGNAVSVGAAPSSSNYVLLTNSGGTSASWGSLPPSVSSITGGSSNINITGTSSAPIIDVNNVLTNMVSITLSGFISIVGTNSLLITDNSIQQQTGGTLNIGGGSSSSNIVFYAGADIVAEVNSNGFVIYNPLDDTSKVLLQYPTSASNTVNTLTLPTVTTTLVGVNNNATLTNKALVANNIYNGSSLPIQLPLISTTLIGQNTNDTLTNKIINSINTNTGTLTFPSNTSTTLDGVNNTATLTNKTIPSIITLSAGTLAFPNISSIDTLVGRSTSDTLTNKIINSINTNTGTLTFPSNTSTTLDGVNNTATLTNKTISTILTNNAGTLAFPNISSIDTLVGRSTSDTLSNKVILTNSFFADTVNPTNTLKFSTTAASANLTLESVNTQNYTLTFPPTVPTSTGLFLQSNVSGVTSWAPVTGGSSTQIQYNTGSGFGGIPGSSVSGSNIILGDLTLGSDTISNNTNTLIVSSAPGLTLNSSTNLLTIGGNNTTGNIAIGNSLFTGTIGIGNTSTGTDTINIGNSLTNTYIAGNNTSTINFTGFILDSSQNVTISKGLYTSGVNTTITTIGIISGSISSENGTTVTATTAIFTPSMVGLTFRYITSGILGTSGQTLAGSLPAMTAATTIASVSSNPSTTAVLSSSLATFTVGTGGNAKNPTFNVADSMIMTNNDYIIFYAGTNGCVVTLLNPSSSLSGRVVTVKDGGGNSSVNQITITTAGGGNKIEGLYINTYIAKSSGSLELTCINNGANYYWYITKGIENTYGSLNYVQNISQTVTSFNLLFFDTQIYRVGTFSDSQYFNITAGTGSGSSTIYPEFFQNISARNQKWHINYTYCTQSNNANTNAICTNLLFINPSHSAILGNQYYQVASYATQGVFSGTITAAVQVNSNGTTNLGVIAAENVSPTSLGTASPQSTFLDGYTQIEIIQIA